MKFGMLAESGELLVHRRLSVVWGLIAVSASVVARAQSPTGNEYMIVAAPGIAWTAASDAANDAVRMGRRGHLATITSAVEQAFIERLLVGGIARLWIGGRQRIGEAGPVAGWEWVNEEGEIGKGKYANWLVDEPDDCCNLGENSEEDFLILVVTEMNSGWADVTEDATVSGYIVEFESAHFIRGDVDSDGSVDITDSIRILMWLFGEATLSCEDAADVNDSGTINITDPIRLLSFLFQGSVSPPEDPFRRCGGDVNNDALGCSMYVCKDQQ